MTTAASATGTSNSQETSSGLDLSILTSLTRTFLEDVLGRIVGAKTLVIDPSLAGPLGLVTEVSTLKSHGVDRMFYLEPGALSQAQRNIVWLCSPKISLMKIIADQIKASDGTRHTYTILLAPRITSLCVSALEDAGVYGSVDVQPFPLEFLTLERDVLSLEYENSYKSLFMDEDYGSIFDMGKALITFQQVYGLIPNVVGKGNAAQRLINIMTRLRDELPSTSALTPGAADSLIIIDRQVDPVTPLCTQLTYEGLVDELVGIRNAHVEVDPALVNPPPNAMPSPSTALTSIPTQAKRKKLLLSSQADPLFGELRDKNFAVVGTVLNRVAKRINSDYEGIHQAQTITQIKGFVGRLGGLQAEHQSLRLHTGLTEEIMKTTMTDEFNRALEIQQNIIAGLDLSTQEAGIRDLLNKEADPTTILRLLCLYSQISGGLKPKILEEFQRDFLQTYGYHHLPQIVALGNLGLLTKPISGKSPFVQSRKPLRLVVDEVDEQAPDDIAYVYSGYAPLSVRLVQGALGRNGAFLGWKSIEEALKVLPGKSVEVKQKVDEETRVRALMHDQSPVTVVCFLGGCTYTEISALRFVSNQGKGGRKIVVCTTGIINGQNVVKSLL